MININQTIAAMSADELRKRLAQYMQNDPALQPAIAAIHVRPSRDAASRCRYDILLVGQDGSETPVCFPDRHSCLVYVLTLLHPQGHRRRASVNTCFAELQSLYSRLFLSEGQKLLSSIGNQGADHFFSQAVARSRHASAGGVQLPDYLLIDRAQARNGKMLIPFVAQGGTVHMHSSLLTVTSNH